MPWKTINIFTCPRAAESVTVFSRNWWFFSFVHFEGPATLKLTSPNKIWVWHWYLLWPLSQDIILRGWRYKQKANKKEHEIWKKPKITIGSKMAPWCDMVTIHWHSRHSVAMSHHFLKLTRGMSYIVCWKHVLWPIYIELINCLPGLYPMNNGALLCQIFCQKFTPLFYNLRNPTIPHQLKHLLSQGYISWSEQQNVFCSVRVFVNTSVNI